MTDESTTTDGAALPDVVDRRTFQDNLDELRAREKQHTREGDAIAAARRRLPAVEVDANAQLIGADGPVTLLEAFEGRRQLIAYYFMWNPDRPAAEQCEGCTFYTSQVGELSYLHSRDITYATKRRGVEAMDHNYALMDLTAYGRQEDWEDSPDGWPQHCSNTRSLAGAPFWPPVSQWPSGRPIAQWARLDAGHPDDLGTAGRDAPPTTGPCH